jgi:predicted metal-dependent phosphoesterase TrpH
MRSEADPFQIAPDAAIDLQTLTELSDGQWNPAGLIDHFVGEGFALAAITDHERVDTAPALQTLAAEKGFKLLVAAELSTRWRDANTDLLCFGFDPAHSALPQLTRDVFQQQCDITREVYFNLCKVGHIQRYDSRELEAMLELPGADQIEALQTLLQTHAPGRAVGSTLLQAGFRFATSDIAAAVTAAHQSGGVILVAHPGRGGEFMRYDTDLLDQLRHEVPIDGLEVYYPRHSKAQTAKFRAYADQHQLLISAGSDSHRPTNPPVKYRAELCQRLLERLGYGLTA